MLLRVSPSRLQMTLSSVLEVCYPSSDFLVIFKIFIYLWSKSFLFRTLFSMRLKQSWFEIMVCSPTGPTVVRCGTYNVWISFHIKFILEEMVLG